MVQVGIRADLLGSQSGGSETYIRNVISALGTIDPHGDYTLFLGERSQADGIPGTEHMRRVVVQHANIHMRLPFLPSSSPLADWWMPSGANSLALVRYGIDVIHVHYAAPLLFAAKLVVSLHDVGYEIYPQFARPDFVAKMRVRVPLTLRRAAAVLTLTEYAKRVIVRRYCVPPEKVVVVPCAAEPIFRPLHDEPGLMEVRARYGTGERFILCVGDLQPRKNIRRLIEAYVKLRQADAIRHKLVLVGRKAWLYDDIFEAARTSGYTDDFIFTGYVSMEDLVALYNAADVFAYPSIFEGFGIPPLEAMACGTPVVTSNTSSLPEVVGDAGIMVDPLDVEAMAQALASVLNNVDLREQLAARGLKRASTFSWLSSARMIRDVYHNVARG